MTQRWHVAHMKGGPKHGEIIALDDPAEAYPRSVIRYAALQPPKIEADHEATQEVEIQTHDYVLARRERPKEADPNAHHWEYHYDDKEGTMTSLHARLLRAATAVYTSVPKDVADDLSALLREAARTVGTEEQRETLRTDYQPPWATATPEQVISDILKVKSAMEGGTTT